MRRRATVWHSHDISIAAGIASRSVVDPGLYAPTIPGRAPVDTVDETALPPLAAGLTLALARPLTRDFPCP
ncbi:MAG: hypothetical protein HZY74_01190 [Brevundimonas sp.]|nr:MAG: hypothetical protein HZY74_01190 [Brevundimonas sp.]